MARPYVRFMAVLLTVSLEVVAAQPAIATPGDAVWVATSDLDGRRDEFAGSVLSPDGSRLYVTGTSGSASSADFRTIAYDALTGSELWVATYDSGGRDRAEATAIATDGSALYVTGASLGVDTASDFATVAYDAATGTQLWVAAHQSLRGDFPSCIAATPDGSSVVVTGDTGVSRRSWTDWATVAYDATTGSRLWKQIYKTRQFDRAQGCSVAPDSSAFFVTGYTGNNVGHPDVVTISYSVSTGAKVWRDRYDGRNGWDEGTDLVVAPSGSSLYVSGISNVGHDPDPLVLAYSSTDGSLQWSRRYPTRGWEEATNVAVAPDGAVYLTGEGGIIVTLAYSASGTRRWARTFVEGAGWAEGEAIAAAPDDSTVYVAGWRYGVDVDSAVTLAYDAATGQAVWQDLERPGNGWEVAVAPNGSAVYVSGDAYLASWDYQTVAYAA